MVTVPKIFRLLSRVVKHRGLNGCLPCHGNHGFHVLVARWQKVDIGLLSYTKTGVIE